MKWLSASVFHERLMDLFMLRLVAAVVSADICARRESLIFISLHHILQAFLSVSETGLAASK